MKDSCWGGSNCPLNPVSFGLDIVLLDEVVSLKRCHNIITTNWIDLLLLIVDLLAKASSERLGDGIDRKT